MQEINGLIVMPASDFRKMLGDLLDEKLAELNLGAPQKEWFTEAEAVAEFNVSRVTLWKRRKDGELEYTTGLRGEILYSRTGIEKLYECRTVYAVGDPANKKKRRGNVLSFGDKKPEAAA